MRLLVAVCLALSLAVLGTGCVVRTNYAYSAGPGGYSRVRRADLDGNCLSIGAPPYGYLVRGYSNQQAASATGCRVGLNRFRSPDPEIYCCPDLVGAQPAYVAASAPAFQRVRRSDLDGNCLSISAPPYGWMVETPYNHQQARAAGCRPGLNMFRSWDPDIYCCPFNTGPAAVAQPVYVAPAAPQYPRYRRTDLDRNCLSIGAPPFGFMVQGYYPHQQAQASGCRPGLNMFARPDPDIYCCPYSN